METNENAVMTDSGVDATEEYVTVADLSKRIHYSPKSIYNMISAGKFVRGVHYLKPTPKKVLFIWPVLKAWLARNEEEAGNSKADAPRYRMGR
ncbi:MAG: hypothetical protein ABSH25_16630 [Syntrophorhabdales bacterium]